MQKDLIYINVGTKGLVDSTGSPIRSASAYPRLERGQWQILCINFVHVTSDEVGAVTVTPANMAGGTYLFVADNNFDDSDDLMLKSFQSVIPFDENTPDSNRINVEGDWIDGSTADLALGQMSIRIYTSTAKFTAVVADRQQVTSGLYINIKQYSPDITAPSTVAWFPFVAHNTLMDSDPAEEQPPAGASIVSFVSAYLKHPTEYQFSVDGSEWHTTQTASDRYYRMRMAGIGVDWGVPIYIQKGYTPQRGVDYWTEEDRDAIKDEMLNQGW